MRESMRHYIDGRWVDPIAGVPFEVINPATEAPAGRIALGDADDVDRAAAAARRAFDTFCLTSRADRVALLESVITEYKKRRNDLAGAISEELGAPAQLADKLHAMVGQLHLKTAVTVLKEYPFETQHGPTRIMLEPIGVCGLITPWNWPVNQISAKVAPALACGCTMVLKPSELSPFSATIWTEILHAAGVPAGVFNMVHGLGAVVGAAISAHPEIDMISFTGSTRAGVEVAQAAAPTIKRVHQELGGKCANILLPDADFSRAVPACVRAVAHNSGQSCNAPTRMLVPADRMEEAIALAKTAAEAISVGAPAANADVGPVVSQVQYDKIQAFIERGVEEGATLVAGGPGRPEGLDAGFFVRPTVFAHVGNDMAIAQEEIFGPVLSIIGYDSLDDAVALANDTPFGLAGYVQGSDADAIQAVVRRLRVGQVLVNNPTPDPMAPFGGYKRSGNGREWGEHGFEAYLEVKAVLGVAAGAIVPSETAGPVAMPA